MRPSQYVPCPVPWHEVTIGDMVTGYDPLRGAPVDGSPVIEVTEISTTGMWWTIRGFAGSPDNRHQVSLRYKRETPVWMVQPTSTSHLLDDRVPDLSLGEAAQLLSNIKRRQDLSAREIRTLLERGWPDKAQEAAEYIVVTNPSAPERCLTPEEEVERAGKVVVERIRDLRRQAKYDEAAYLMHHMINAMFGGMAS